MEATVAVPVEVMGWWGQGAVKRAATEKDTEKRGWSRAMQRRMAARLTPPGTHPKNAWQVPGLGVDDIRG